MKIKIHYISGISGDRIEVSILNDNGKQINKESYAFGYNASYNRENASYSLKPYIGDILISILNKYHMTIDDAEYSGYYVFIGREATPTEIIRIKKDLFAEV